MTARPPGETILLVEDDPPIRHILRRMLEGQGYQLLVACNGHEALGLAADHSGPIDLLVTDVVMPRMDGFTLGERLVESDPEIRVLFMSGYADLFVTLRGRLKKAGHPFLVKPFSSDCLLRTIREQLDSEPSRRTAPGAEHLIGPVL